MTAPAWFCTAHHNLHEKWDDGYEAGKMVAPILGALALPYADHPDCREEWKP